MKRILFILIDMFTYPFALLSTEKVSLKVSLLLDKIYTFTIRRRFKTAPRSVLFGRCLNVTGCRYIEIGENTNIKGNARIDAIDFYEKTGQMFTPTIKIGSDVGINTLCHIGCINRIEIGNYTTLGARTYITDHLHGEVTKENLYIPPRHRMLFSKGPVIIGSCVSIGEGCAIMPGVTIGDHVVIGANSVVTRDIPSYSVVAGNPAKVLKNFSE